MVDGVGIIHMNGRIYDAHLGRFLQADPIIQEPTLIGSLNRYSYVMNNPLNGIDPTGYSWLSDRWQDVRPYVGAVVGAAMLIWSGGLSGPTYYAFVGATSGMITAGLTGAQGMDVFQATAFGALTGAAGGALGGGAEGFFMAGLIGGTLTYAQGGQFGHGFVSASVGTLIGGKLPDAASRIMASAVLGGTMSEITGGKFKNGAASAAFAAVMGELGRGGNSKLTNNTDGVTPKRANYSEEKQSLIQGELDFLNDTYSEQSIGRTADEAVIQLHKLTQSLRENYFIEFGARIIQLGKGEFGFSGLYTEFYNGSITATSLTGDVGWWHSHGPSVSILSIADVKVANVVNVDMYASSTTNISKYARSEIYNDAIASGKGFNMSSLENKALDHFSGKNINPSFGKYFVNSIYYDGSKL